LRSGEVVFDAKSVPSMSKIGHMDFRMRTNADLELDAEIKTFASGLLPELMAALRRSRKGDLVVMIRSDPSLGPELKTWCRFTRNSLVDTAVKEGRARCVSPALLKAAP
jgi:hypothetical protein